MNNIKKISITIIIALSLIIAGCASNSTKTDNADASDEVVNTLAKVKENGRLEIGLEGNWQPWSFHDENDSLVGYDVELGKAIAQKLGVEAAFTTGAWDGLFAGLSSGRYDLVINGVDITDERKENFDFSVPYAYTHTVLLVSGDNGEIKSFEDLKDKTTANSVGSTYMELGEKYGAKVEGVESLEDTINMVASKRVDATINSDVSIADYMKIRSDVDVKIVDQTDEVIEVAIPMVKGEASKELLEAVNKAIDELKNDGTLKKLSEKYFGIDVTMK